jgi:hypothetical protein
MGEITLKLMAYISFTVNGACLPGKDARGYTIQVFGLFRDFGETGRWKNLKEQRTPGDWELTSRLFLSSS